MTDKAKKKTVRKKNQVKLDELYLNAAILCQQILDDTDGTNSLIKVMDKIVIHGSIPEADFVEFAEVEPPIVSMYVFLAVKTAKAINIDVQFVIHSPNGKIKADILRSVISSKDWGGVKFKLNLSIAVRELGLHWIEVKLNGKQYTMIPLHIRYLKTEQPDS